MSKIIDNPAIAFLLDKAIKNFQEENYTKSSIYFEDLIQEMKVWDDELFRELINKIWPLFKIEDITEGKLSLLDKAKAVFADKENAISNSIFASIYNDLGVYSYNNGKTQEAFEYYIKAVSTIKIFFSDHYFLPVIIKNIQASCNTLIKSDVKKYNAQFEYQKLAELIEKILKSLKEVSLEKVPNLELDSLYANLGISYNKLNQHELALENLYKVAGNLAQFGDSAASIVAVIANSHQKIISVSDYDRQVISDALMKMTSGLPKDNDLTKQAIDFVKSQFLASNNTSVIEEVSEAADSSVVSENQGSIAQSDFGLVGQDALDVN